MNTTRWTTERKKRKNDCARVRAPIPDTSTRRNSRRETKSGSKRVKTDARIARKGANVRTKEHCCLIHSHDRKMTNLISHARIEDSGPYWYSWYGHSHVRIRTINSAFERAVAACYWLAFVVLGVFLLILRRRAPNHRSESSTRVLNKYSCTTSHLAPVSTRWNA